MESSTPYKGGEIDSRQAEAIDTLSSANEYQGQSRIQTLRKLPWNRKWKYFRDQLLARTVVIAAIVCVVVYIAVQILAPAPGPKLYVAVFDDAVGQQGAASLQSQVAKRMDLPEGRKGGVLAWCKDRNNVRVSVFRCGSTGCGSTDRKFSPPIVSPLITAPRIQGSRSA